MTVPGAPRRDHDSPVSRERGFCPCCGCKTLSPAHPGSYEVCRVCGWLEDLVGFHCASTESDYNHVSLREVREHGVCRPELADRTGDPGGVRRDPNWPYDDP